MKHRIPLRGQEKKLNNLIYLQFWHFLFCVTEGDDS